MFRFFSFFSSVGLVKFLFCFFYLLFFHKFKLPIGEIKMNIKERKMRGVLADHVTWWAWLNSQAVRRCHPMVAGSTSGLGVTTLSKSVTPMCLCHRAV